MRCSGDVDDARDGRLIDADVGSCLDAHFGDKLGLENQHINNGAPLFVAHALRADGFDASEDGTGRGTPLVPVHAVAFAENSRAEVRMMDGDGQIAPQLTTGGGKPGQGQPCIAFHASQDPDFGDVTHPLDTDGSSIGVITGWRVRRLTPTECERIQGFPDGYTAVPFRGKPAADGPRYKALGNSMAVNVMRWIGRRIEMVERIAP